MTDIMVFRRPDKSKGFSLVELLLVIVLMAILMAVVTLSGSNMMESTSAQTEARRLVRSLQSLRSAWLACYSDTQQMPGLTVATTSVELQKLLGTYSDRVLNEERGRYGPISFNSFGNPDNIFIGFSGPWDLDAKTAQAQTIMEDVLETQKDDYEINFNKTTHAIFIKVR
ncbi:MAG: prepilin-type N-terminal cleavage/methylation domain-containing protein [Synergistaceae bacterium]|jgi:prepilin-type N-terminal cleavage/methylation domain-containing protein|nr:prepilin-type N-terminal cleavage/methylation domain-containing protein [Synergistaceae bacterium]